MNLQNSYHLLTKDERLALYLQAVSRKDQQEIQAVIRASPKYEAKMTDFFFDLNALLTGTLFHCLCQLDVFILITLMSTDLDNDRSRLSARLHAKHYVVSDEAWRSVCKESGLDYDEVLKTWRSISLLNSGPFSDWVKELASGEIRYNVEANVTAILEPPTVEEMKEKYRRIIATLREGLG